MITSGYRCVHTVDWTAAWHLASAPMATVLCVLYDDPVDGYPPDYARDGMPKIASYPDGQTTPTPEAIDFAPGELLGSVSGELGLRRFLEDRGHQLVVTSDKDGPGLGVRARAARGRGRDLAAVLARLPDRRADREGAEPEAGDHGGDRLGPRRPRRRRSSTGSPSPRSPTRNSISVSEHVVMMILALVRNYIPSYQWVVDGGWNIADCVSRSYDLEGMQVGTVAAGRIGSAVLRRLKPFDVGLHYTDRHRLPAEVEEELGVTFHADAESMVAGLRRGHDQRAAAPRDRAPLRRRADREMKRGAYIVNTARGKICDRDAIVARARERPARRLRRRRLVPAAGAAGPPVADDAPPRHDAAHLRLEPLGAGPLRGRHARDPRVLVRRPADPRGVPDRGGRRSSPAPARTPTARGSK